MLELFRRAVLALAVFGSIWMAAYTTPGVIAIHNPDFQRRFEKKKRLMEDLTFEHYLADETSGPYSMRLEGSENRAWHDRIMSFLAGGVDDPELKRRVSRGYYQGEVYYDPADPQVAKIAAGLNRDKTHVYVEFDGTGPGRYMSVTLRQMGDMNYAPGWIVHPMQRNALYLFLAGIGLYILIPWKRPGGPGFRYNRIQGAILPDFMGIIMGGGFFAIPLFVCTRDSNMASIVQENGYLGVTLVGLLLGSGGIVTWIVSAWYSAYEILLLSDRVRFNLLLKSEEYLISDIEEVNWTVYKPWKWLKIARTLAFLTGNWKAAAAMTAGTLPQSGLMLKARDGRSRRFVLTGFSGAERFLLSLRNAGVRVPDEVIQSLFEEGEPIPEAVPQPPPVRSAAGWQLFWLVLLGVVVAITFGTIEKNERKWNRTALPTPVATPHPGVVLAQSRILKQMNVVNAEMSAALEQAKNATGDAQKKAIERFEKAQEEFNKLQEQHAYVEAHPETVETSQSLGEVVGELLE